MYGVNLFRLARLAGLKRIDIARHLGVVRMQATYWGQGKRPIPDDRVAPLVALIAQAVKKRLAAAAPWDTIRADLTAALTEVFAENCHRSGHAPVASLASFMDEFERYAALSQRQQQQEPKLEHIERYTAAMLFWLELRHALLPLLRLLPDDEAADTVEDTSRKGMSVR